MWSLLIFAILTSLTGAIVFHQVDGFSTLQLCEGAKAKIAKVYPVALSGEAQSLVNARDTVSIPMPSYKRTALRKGASAREPFGKSDYSIGGL